MGGFLHLSRGHSLEPTSKHESKSHKGSGRLSNVRRNLCGTVGASLVCDRLVVNPYGYLLGRVPGTDSYITRT